LTAREWALPGLLFGLTFLSTLFVGASYVGVPFEAMAGPRLLEGWTFAVPLMGILLAHELGHYVAGRLHGVDISPPFFIPMPLSLLGTMGAVIAMRSPLSDRRALLDVGAAGPLAGLVVALPVLAWGLVTSDVQPLPEEGTYIIEGRGLLYLAMLYAIHGPLPDGHDVFLSAPALAGWAGLLVTMINLIPVGQLDGGHVAYALFGERQNAYGRAVHRALPFLGIAVSTVYVAGALAAGDGDLWGELSAGIHWLFWAGLLLVLRGASGGDHPPTERGSLGPWRRGVAILTLVFFVLLFMPSWIRTP
jgi:membrane-associated protease RseP (regulator of RpoE activity)